MRREMRTFDARARSGGRTPAGRPDGPATGRARGHRVIRTGLGTAAPHRMGRKPPRQRLAYSPAFRADEARRSQRSRPRGVAETAWRLAATLTCDDALGIHLAESLPRGALDLIEYALRSSPSLGKGLDRLARYGRLLSDRVAARTHRKGEGLLLLVHDTATTPLQPARAEFALAVALKLARDSTGADITPVRVCFAHPAPDHTAEHRRFFHGRVRFGAGSSSMTLSASDASRPMREADAALAGIIRRRLENALGDRDRSKAGAMSTRVRRMLVERLGQSVLTLDAVATALARQPADADPPSGRRGRVIPPHSR